LPSALSRVVFALFYCSGYAAARRSIFAEWFSPLGGISAQINSIMARANRVMPSQMDAIGNTDDKNRYSWQRHHARIAARTAAAAICTPRMRRKRFVRSVALRLPATVPIANRNACSRTADQIRPMIAHSPYSPHTIRPIPTEGRPRHCAQPVSR